jgi:hypothetical protein
MSTAGESEAIEAGEAQAHVARAPLALRPAVEIIARLSADRTKLKARVARLEAGRGGEAAALRTVLERVQAERDEARREAEQARSEREQLVQERDQARAEAAALSLELAKVTADRDQARTVDPVSARLERVAARLEQLAVSGSLSRPAEPHTAAPTPAPTRRETPKAAPAAAPSKGGGMLAGLVKQNLGLKPNAEPAKAPEPKRSGGMLGALVAQNRALRPTTPNTTPHTAAPVPEPSAPAPAPTTHRTEPVPTEQADPAISAGGLLARLIRQNLAAPSAAPTRTETQAA